MRSDFRIYQSTLQKQGVLAKRERQEKRIEQVQKYSEVMFLLFLLAGNTFSLYNSFEIFHFQYNRSADQKDVLNKQFDYLTNGYQQSTFWFYMNLKLGFNLLSELVLFIIISLKVSEQKYNQYYIVQIIMVVLQLLVTFQSIWPFSSHSQYGFDFEKKRKQIIQSCQNPSSDESSLSYFHLQCNFSQSIFYMIRCAQALIIVAFISLSGVSASTLLKNKYPQVLSERVRNIRRTLVPESESVQDEEDVSIPQSNGMVKTRTVTFNKISDIVVQNEKKKVDFIQEKQCETVKSIKEDAKKNSKVRRPSFWSNSYARTEASSSSYSSQAEDSQNEADHSWQPSYITFSNSKKEKNIYGEKTANFQYPSTGYSGYQPPSYLSERYNPSLNLNKHFLDRSMDDDQLDIEENRQL